MTEQKITATALASLDFNPILYPDSYKQSHFTLYPGDMKRLAAYVEPRFGQAKSPYEVVVFAGIQAYVMKYLMRPVTAEEIDEAEGLMKAHGLPFNREGWDIVLNEYGGHLPLQIEALPEGTVHKLGVPQVQVTTTDERLASFATYVETSLLRAVWYMSTVATNSFRLKLKIRKFLDRSAEEPDAVLPFMLHDFGARGATSGESAMLGGIGHLISFMGTDTSEALIGARRIYGEDCAGFSIPAIEHSAIMAWGRDNEIAAIANEIDSHDGEGRLFSIVSDTYDLWNTIDNIYGGVLKTKIENMKGKLVVRPDSGDPVETPIMVVKRLYDIFGGHVNKKGFKVLSPKVGVIQGDGMNAGKIERLYTRLLEEGYSAENVVVGMGGGMLQGVMRDDLGYAMKANEVQRGDQLMDIQKKPKTDPTKASKAGLQAVLDFHGEPRAIRKTELDGRPNLLQTVYLNGKMIRYETLAEVRARADEKARFLTEKGAFHRVAA